MYLNRSKMYMPCGHLPPLIAAAEKVSYTKFLRIKPLISTSGGRFPWVTPQLPRKQNPLPAGFSAVAFPTGVAALCSNQLDLLITYSFSVVSSQGLDETPQGAKRLRRLISRRRKA